MSEDFTVRLPFQLSGGKTISDLREGTAGTILGLPAKLQGSGSKYLLSVAGLPSEADALAFLRKLASGLLWTALEKHTGIVFSLTPRQIEWFPDPVAAAENMRKMLGLPLGSAAHAEKILLVAT